MRVLLIFAALLMVPLMMGVQRRDHETRGAKKLGEKVLQRLRALEIDEPGAAVEWLDVEIWGIAESLEHRRVAEEAIEGLAGVRLQTEGRRLAVAGSLRVVRAGKEVKAEGLIPVGWGASLFQGELASVAVENLREADQVVIPGASFASWGILLDQMCGEEASRSLVLEGGELRMGGEATPELAEKLRLQAVEIMGVEKVQFDFELFPSRFHYPSRSEEQLKARAELEPIMEGLRQALVNFEKGSSRLSERGREELAKVASLMMSVGGGERFVIGAHPDEGGAQLARRRTQVVLRMLVEDEGLSRSRLEFAIFEAVGGESQQAGQVEVLIL